MYTNLGSVVLKDGRCAEAGVVRAPDLDWAPRIELFLKHQASIWNWQNRRMLRSEVGIDAHYYVLHRGGRLLSTMMTGEHQGVGIRGHVWTRPEERCKGACSGLQTVQMEHFLARGGRFLCLYTHHNSVAFHIYRKAGFREAEPGSGHMIFRSQPGETFEDDYFAAGATSVEPLDWRHWPTASPLFLGDFGGQVRYSWYGLVGSQSSEHALLQDLRKQENGNHPVERQVMVLRHEASQAVVGLAAWNRHSPAGTCLLDIYCHPSFWSESERLLASLQLPQAERYISYVDSTCAYKANCLRRHGFHQAAAWPGFPVDLCRTPWRLLPRGRLGGRLAKACCRIGRAVDAPISGCWKRFVGERARRHIPERWPTIALTRRLSVDLVLYDKSGAAD